MSNSIEQFGKYILLEKLAAGGMAEVYLAKSTGANGVNKFLAIKRILPQFSDNEEFINMFKEEAKIAVNLNHGNVVSIYDFGVEKSHFFLVMEYVEGRNLRQMINELKKKSIHLSTEQIVYIIKEVAAGLDHAHRCIDGSTGKPLNITHRDMSPQNIMVSYEGEVKIIDFGIAKAENQLESTKAGTLKGKFGYMSPEQADGYPIDLRTDVFSLGIVLWELLASDRLFTSSSEAAILRKIRDCQIPPIRKINPSVHPELERIVGKALAKDKSLRYQTAAALHRDLNRFLNTQYPEFSPHDFSVYIKNAFTETFSAQKKKLVEFAKILNQLPEDTVKTHAEKDEDDSVVKQPPGEQNTLGTTTDEESFNLEMPLLEKNLSATVRTFAPLQENGTGPLPRTGATNNANSRSPFPNSGQSSSQIRRQPVKPKAQNSYSVAFVLIALMAISAGYLMLGRNQIQNDVIASNLPGSTNQLSQKPPVENSGQAIPNNSLPPSAATVPNDSAVASPSATLPTDAAARPATEVLATPATTTAGSNEKAVATIYSDPDNASLYIDDIETGFRTPYRLSKPMNQKFKIKLTKAGYFPLEKTITLEKSSNTLRFSLTKEAYGYISLYIVNGGSSPTIEVNGALVTGKTHPFTHKVPAGVPITIKVTNEFLETSANETVSVTENQKKFVELVLKAK
jgi:serine/threonine protein kinase